MSTTATDRPGAAETPAPAARKSFWEGRSELGVVALLFLVATLLAIGTATMDVMGASVPGPQFFPVIVCVVLYVTGAALLIDVLRNPQVPDTDPHPGQGDFSRDLLDDVGQVHGEATAARGAGLSPKYRTYSDWKTIGLIVGALVFFILLLDLVGWIFTAAFLFWVVARVMGSRRPVFDLGVALLFSSLIQLAFSAGLGLPLPSGFLEGLL